MLYQFNLIFIIINIIKANTRVKATLKRVGLCLMEHPVKK